MDEQKRTKLNRFWGIWNFIEALILLAAGILAIVIAFTNDGSSNVNVESIIAYVVGAFVLLDGTLRIVMSFAHYHGPKDTDESGMLVGGFELAVGIVMILLEVHFYALTNQHVFTYLIAHFIATLLIVIGLLLIVFSIVTIVKKYSGLFMPILEILFSAILVGVGITIFILYYKQNNTNIVLVLTGSVLSVAGIAQGIITIITLKKAKKEINKVHEVDAVDPKEESKVKNDSKAKETPIENKQNDVKQIENVVEVEKIEGPKE